MAFNWADLSPLGGLLGGSAAWVTWRYTHRKQRAEAEFIRALQQDEILGHKNIQGIPDKLSLSERHTQTNDRLAALEIITGQMAKELHPNGGSSMIDTVNSTYKLAQNAAINSAAVAETMDRRERMRLAGEKLLRERIRAHREMTELNDLLDLLPPEE